MSRDEIWLNRIVFASRDATPRATSVPVARVWLFAAADDPWPICDLSTDGAVRANNARFWIQIEVSFQSRALHRSEMFCESEFLIRHCQCSGLDTVEVRVAFMRKERDSGRPHSSHAVSDDVATKTMYNLPWLKG